LEFDWFYFLSLVITAIRIGFGSAIGNYLANKTLIKNFEKMFDNKKNKN